MSILIVGDPHFRISAIYECKVMASKIVEYATDIKPSMIVVLGDILDRHETIHVEPLTHACKFLEDLSKISSTYVLIGNHDRPNNSDFLSDRHPFPLAESDSLHIVYTTLKVRENGNIYTFVPYVPPGRFMEALSKVSGWEKSRYIFAHQEFKGAKMGAIVSEIGDEWNSSYPHIYSGHIHDYQELENITYVGTPMAHAFGDRDDKTVSLVKSDGTHERIDLELPLRKLEHKTATDIIKIDPSTYSIPEGTLLKIVIEGTHAENTVASKSDSVKQLQKKGIKIVFRDLRNGQEPVPERIENKLFHQLLFEAVENNKELKPLVKELFESS